MITKNDKTQFLIARIISDLRNGFCFCLVENSRKTLFFCQKTIHPQILESFNNFKIITTKEYYNYHFNAKKNNNVILKKDFAFEDFTLKKHNIALEICKTAELQPVAVAIETQELPPCPYQEIDIDDLEIDIKNFRYEINHLATSKIQLKNAPNAEIMVFGSKFGGHEHYAILINNPLQSPAPLVRIHSSCYTGDLLASLRCDCRDQLQDSIFQMNQTSGILLYLLQEGRGIGLANKIIAYNYQQEEGLDTVESNFAVGFEDDERSFVPAFKILEFLNQKDIRLLTNNPKKKNDLSHFGINIVETVSTIFEPHNHNKDYLDVKAKKMGHKFSEK